MSGVVRLSEHLYLIEDTCNVYLVTDGDAGLAVGFGSGLVLEHLERLGVTHLDWVLHTHHHRDECQGDSRALAAGTRLAVPESERRLFEEAGALWAAGDLPGPIFGPRHFSLAEGVAVAEVLRPGEAFEWRGHRFEVLATPCQTPGSVSLVAEVDAQRVAFVGDLIAEPGRVWDFGQLQWSYLRYEGLEALAGSIETVLGAEPDLLCPSHGRPMEEPVTALTELALRAEQVRGLVSRNPIGRWNWSDLVQLSPHLLKDAGTTTYIVLSDDGHALLFDLGEFKPDLFGLLRERYGVRAVDAVVVSHFHWDHTGGIPELVRRFGSKVWALDLQRDILEHPENYAMSFAESVPLRPDRFFHDGESTDWRGYRLTFMHLPAHTHYHLGMLARVDGKPTLFSADAVAHVAGNEVRTSFVCRNRIFLNEGAVKTARQLFRHRPYLVCPAHADPFVLTERMSRRFLQWSLTARDGIAGLIARPHPEMGFDPYWVRVEPYLVRVPPGGEAPCRVLVRNHLPLAAPVELELVPPEGVEAEPGRFAAEVEPGEERAFAFVLRCAPEVETGRRLMTVEVTFAHRRYGQLTEALIEARG